MVARAARVAYDAADAFCEEAWGEPLKEAERVINRLDGELSRLEFVIPKEWRSPLVGE